MATQLHYAVFLFPHQDHILDAYLSVTGEEAPSRQPFPLLWRELDTPGNVPPHSGWFGWHCTDADWDAFVAAIPPGIANNPNTSLYTEENFTLEEVLGDTTRKDFEHRVDNRI